MNNLKKDDNSTDSVDNGKTLKNLSAEKCDSRNSYNPDDDGIYYNMIRGAVEMKILVWFNIINTIDGYNNNLDFFLEILMDQLRDNCLLLFQDYCNDQDEENEYWYDLPLQEKVAQFVEEESDSVINCAIQDSELYLKVLEHLKS